MRRLGVALLVLGACYQGPSADVACKLRCTDSCPSGLSCVDGLCVGPGGSCGATGDATLVDASAPDCVADVGLGWHHTCAVKRDGTVWCAGNNDYGQLGTDMIGGEDQATFVQARTATGPITDAIAVTASGATDNSYTCALRTGGTVWCWGGGANGTLGNGAFTTTPHAVQVLVSGTNAPLVNVVEIGAGAYHACARTSAGNISCWGYGGNGRLGDGTFNTRGTAAPVQNNSGVAFSGVTKLAVARSHSCFVAGTQVWCWGANDNGRVGDGTQTDALRPVSVTTGTSVAGGRLHTCASHPDGTASCWGGAFHGRIGDGSFSGTRLTPTKVLVAPGGAELQGVKAVAVGGVSCALMTDGRGQCWGTNTHGQTGTGTGSTVPGVVVDERGVPITNIERLVAGFTHVCAFRTGGGVLCWGRNDNGELAGAIGTGISHPTPLALACP